MTVSPTRRTFGYRSRTRRWASRRTEECCSYFTIRVLRVAPTPLFCLQRHLRRIYRWSGNLPGHAGTDEGGFVTKVGTGKERKARNEKRSATSQQRKAAMCTHPFSPYVLP